MLSLKLINLLLLGLDLLIRGRQPAKLVELEISCLDSVNYDAILVRS